VTAHPFPIWRVLFNGTLIFWLIAEVRQALRGRRDATVRDDGSLRLIRVTLFAGILVSSFFARSSTGVMPWRRVDLFGVGIVLMWLGIGLRLWAFRTLGKFFTFRVMTSEDQPVVSGGPYRVLRHPSYAGALLALIGIGVANGNWYSFAAIVLIPAVGMINRIRVEERALHADLGERYTEFAARRKRLVPFVW
jgi:protein-S-isoprenylcysteine O-methyltransferase Ste14